ncbi:nuclear transport factor 2 family protein [Flavobacterium sp. SUN046]|uniref:nuclear transport factor 2 family protein n=1 Tax=Flavobacterium sp. SUN046 TaxID=3002440 RepID=UPI002DBDCE6B|nr:nuclear transport factor 2 family protein [Flavobacterium sp. SUN046]MEC4048505.1 nuclear transport factor 2 family protein [Flavobacterium sp. SUN046]
MKKQLILGLALLAISSSAQSKKSTDKDEINKKVKLFMDCIIKKDTVQFYSLFNSEPTVFKGVFKEKSQKDGVRKNPSKFISFISTSYKDFYSSISDNGANQEKFNNIKIDEDGYVASLSFDYSFWNMKKKINWGKEIWSMIKVNGKWQITSIIFSLEFEDVVPEPKK